MQDAHGRAVTLTQDERGFVYALAGCEVIFEERNDERALEQISMLDAPPPPLDPARLEAECEEAIEKLLNDTAAAHGYKDLERCTNYRGSSNPFWNAEGVRAFAWRDECWMRSIEIRDAAKIGNWPTPGAGQIPTVAEVVAAMPAADWPVAAA